MFHVNRKRTVFRVVGRWEVSWIFSRGIIHHYVIFKEVGGWWNIIFQQNSISSNFLHVGLKSLKSPFIYPYEAMQSDHSARYLLYTEGHSPSMKWLKKSSNELGIWPEYWLDSGVVTNHDNDFYEMDWWWSSLDVTGRIEKTQTWRSVFGRNPQYLRIFSWLVKCYDA